MTSAGNVPQLTVRSLLDERSGLRLVLLAGEAGLARRIAIARIQKPGLALAGFLRQVHPERVQVLGATEISFLASMPTADAKRSVDGFVGLNPACIVVTEMVNNVVAHAHTAMTVAVISAPRIDRTHGCQPPVSSACASSTAMRPPAAA